MNQWKTTSCFYSPICISSFQLQLDNYNDREWITQNSDKRNVMWQGDHEVFNVDTTIDYPFILCAS